MADHVRSREGRDPPAYPVREASGPEVSEFFDAHGTSAVGRIWIIPKNWVARDILAAVVGDYEVTDDPRCLVASNQWLLVKAMFPRLLKEYSFDLSRGSLP